MVEHISLHFKMFTAKLLGVCIFRYFTVDVSYLSFFFSSFSSVFCPPCPAAWTGTG